MKNFFEEKKRSLKFKLAGPGHKLSESTPESSASSSKCEPPAEKRVDTKESQEKRSAILAAALQRSLGNTTKSDVTKKRVTKPAVAGSASDVSEAIEPRNIEENPSGEPSDSSKSEEVHGVFFKCPALGDDVHPKPVWKELIRHHIDELKDSDPILASILAIKSLNSPKEADQCIAIIIKYLRNLIQFPDNDKYKSIRMGNPRFSECVLSVDGALDFLISVGFSKELVEGDVPEYHLVYKPESQPDLESYIFSLLDTNGLELVLDRDFKMFTSSDIALNDSMAVSDDFFELTVSEVKKQQQNRILEVERDSMLMTKKMREMISQKSTRKKALFTRIRIKFPNDLLIQGTFSVDEKLKNLREFIEEKFEINSTYMFIAPPAHYFELADEDKTFSELDLQPAVQLMLKPSSENTTITLKN